MKIEDAIARSISHNEIVRCEFEGDETALTVWLHDNVANGNDAVISRENDGTLDVCDIDMAWRIRVALSADIIQVLRSSSVDLSQHRVVAEFSCRSDAMEYINTYTVDGTNVSEEPECDYLHIAGDEE